MPRVDSDPAATSVYAVSVDSRSRPPEQPDNRYTISMGRTLDRVKSVQLGSIQIPDCRYAFDSTAALHYCEPMTVLPNTHLFVQELVVTCDKISGSQTSVTRTVQLALPPTLNRIVNYDAAAGVLQLEHVSGLDFGITFYPAIGLQISVIGAHFPQSLMTVPMPAPFPTVAGPVLTQQTVAPQPAGYYGPPSPTLSPDTTLQYAPGYLDALVSGAGDLAARHVLFDGEGEGGCLAAWSYVAAPKLTLVELFTLLNAALAQQALLGPSQLTGSVTGVVQVGAQVQVTTAADHGLHACDQVTLTGVGGAAGANGTFFVHSVPSSTTFLVTATAGGAYTGGGQFSSPRGLTGVVQFGFDDANNAIKATAPSIVRETRTSKITISYTLAAGPRENAVPGIVSLAAYVGFGAQSLEPPAVAKVPDYIVRTLALRPGNYNPLELCASLNVRWNPLYFDPAFVPAAQTLHLVLPTGTLLPLVIPPGRFTPVQFVDFLNAQLVPAPAQVHVAYNAVTGKFTFTQLLGLQFGLDFSRAESALLAAQLGFKHVGYSGAAAYVSEMRAVYGVPVSAPPGVDTFPANTYVTGADDTQNRFTFDTGDLPQLTTNASIVDTAACPYTVLWTPAGPLGLAWQPNEVVNARAPYYFAAVTGASNTAPITITVGAPHGLSDGDSVTVTGVLGNVSANGTWFIANAASTTFDLVGSDGSGGGGGAYVAGSGSVASNSVSGVATNTYQIVVSSPIDYLLPAPSPLAGTLGLQPTVSIFSTLSAGTVHEALLQPSATRRVLLQSAARDVFQLLFSHPATKPTNFGFPPISWPPSAKALQLFHGGSMPTYDPVTQAVPVANSYTSPFCWNMLAPPYILMLLCSPAGSKDGHTHAWKTQTTPVFAKLYISGNYLSISDQMQFVTFAGYQRMNSVTVAFVNPDGTPVEFNGANQSFELLFTLAEDAARTDCF